MPIENHPSGSITVSGEAMKLVRFYAIKTALEFELKTGMKMSRVSALRAAKRDGFKGRLKKEALVWVCAQIEAAEASGMRDR